MHNLRVRFGTDDYLLVSRRDLLDLRDRVRARAFVEGGRPPAPDELDEPLAIDAIVEALATGSIVPVRIARSPRLMQVPEPRPLLDPSRPLEPDSGGPRPRPLVLEVLHETGGVFAHARFVVELADGTLLDGILDDRSRWAHPGLTEACTIHFHAPLRLTEDEQRRPSSASCRPGPDDRVAPVGSTPQLRLRPGRDHRLVVQLPPPVPAVALDAGVFVDEQAFVTPGVARALDAVTDMLRDDPRARIMALASADGDADPSRDKALSDRRARALAAVLTNDVPAFEALARDDGWSLRHDQAMLRGLGCNPAAIDGVDGPLTRRAVGWFQDEWSRGVHHPDGLAAPLDVTGTLDAATRRALREAYLLALSPQLTPDRLAGPGAVGCAGFTRSPSPREPGRGGSLALWPGPPPGPSLPCRAGDPGACRLDDRDEHDRCRFHRETFVRTTASIEPCFYDFDWLRLPSGAFNLSAITSLPDRTPVRFWVMRDVQDYDGHVRQHHGPSPLPLRGTVVGEPFPGIVRYGVCVALWHAPEGWDPLRWRDWWTDLEPEDEDEDEDEDEPEPGPLFHPPLFAIEYDGGWAFSRPPGERIDRFALRDARRTGLALANDGRFVAFQTTEGDRIVSAQERRADEHLQILGWCSYEDHLSQDQEAA